MPAKAERGKASAIQLAETQMFQFASTKTRGYLDLARLSVLVVDDNRNTLTLLTEVLRGLGIGEIVRAERLNEAFRRLRGQRFDLILTDIALGDEDGLDFVRHVRQSADPWEASTPVVVVSSHATTSQVIASGAAGASHFLSKPISVGALARQMVDALHSPRAVAKPPPPIALSI